MDFVTVGDREFQTSELLFRLRYTLTALVNCSSSHIVKRSHL